MRGARHVGVQPAAAVGLQQRAGCGEQAYGALRVALLPSDGGQCLEVVGGAWLVPGLGRQRQSLLQQSCGVGRVTLRLGAERQVIERDQDGDPVWRAAGRGQAVGEVLCRAVVISLAELDLAEEVLR